MSNNAAPPSSNQPTQVASDRVPMPQKICYGLGSFHDMWGHWFYISVVYLIFNITLGVSPEWIGNAMVFKLIFEAIWDSYFGWRSDNTRTRFGRRRPYILVGGVLAGLGLPLLFAASTGWGDTHFLGLTIPKYFWFMVGTLAVYVPIISCFNLPFQSLGAELTPDYQERTRVFSVRSIIQKFAEIGNFAGGAFATAGVWVGATWADVPNRLGIMLSQTGEWFVQVMGALFAFDFGRLGSVLNPIFGLKADPSGQKNALMGIQVYCILLGAVLIVIAITMFVVLRERYYKSVVVDRKQEQISITETLWQALSCRPFRANLFMALAYGIGTSMVGTLGYYATIYYVCRGDVAGGNVWNFWMGLSMIAIGICGIPVYASIANRFGKRLAMMAVLVSSIVVFVATWWLYDPTKPWLQTFASGFIAFTQAGFWMLYGSIGADIIDYDEAETGKRREGAFTACGSWIMKFGQAIALTATGWLLKATGFDQALGANQTEQSLFWIRFLLAAIPVCGLVLGMIALMRYGLTPQKLAEIRAKLEARRGRV